MKPPMLSSSTAAALSIFYTILYVLPFYLHPTTRPAPSLSRDSPIVIQTRIRLVSLSVALCTLTTYYVLSQQGNLSLSTITHSLGFYPFTIASLVKPLLLTAILFLGPLLETLIVDNGLRDFFSSLSSSSITDVFSATAKTLFYPPSPSAEAADFWIFYRNYLAAPLTEELLFRSLLLALHLHSSPSSPPSPLKLIFTTPLYFGIAHIHHLYEFRLTHPSHPSILPAVIRSLVQFAYTTLFGWYASFLFLRTGCLWGVVGVHAFCNWMGLPRVWGRVVTIPPVCEPVQDVAVRRGEVGVVGGMVGDDGNNNNDEHEQDGKAGRGGGDAVRRRRRRRSSSSSSRRTQPGRDFTIAYYACLIGGAVAWWHLRWVLTECADGALVEL